MDLDHIRNFSIIAHIDHGKSTLADRILELTGTVTARDMKEQLLDTMDLERERGITIKAQAVRIDYKARDGQNYQLNLIDTPGHVDFTYEVSRSLAACESAVLVVDTTQGVEAQTVANAYLAIDNDLEIIPVLNKIDLPATDVRRGRARGARAHRRHARRAAHGVGQDRRGRRGRARSRGGAHAAARRRPRRRRSRALIFDSQYDQYRGVIAYVRVVDGAFARREMVQMMGTGQRVEVEELGYFGPEMVPGRRLETGEVGYIITGVKDVAQVRVGDTITALQRPAARGPAGLQGRAADGLLRPVPDRGRQVRASCATRSRSSS